MSNADWALQVAIHTALVGHAGLLGLLGGPKVYDHVVRARTYPYVTIGQSGVRDWSTGTEAGHEHIVTLHVWSQSAGRREAGDILQVCRQRLHDQPLSVAGHHLVNLRVEFSDIRREPDGETYHGLLRLRAVTEPA